MRRDHVAEYATHAFMQYGVWIRRGSPRNGAEKGFLEDMDACTCAMQSLTPSQREAVRCVYLQGVLNRKQQYAAVRYYATHAGYTDERTVYRWLQHARTAFAKARGLNCIVQTKGQGMQ